MASPSSSAGSNLPTGFLVGVDPDPSYGYFRWASLAPNASATIPVPPGSHAVWLDQIAGNCSVSGANLVQVDVALATTTDVAFTVTCQ